MEYKSSLCHNREANNVPVTQYQTSAKGVDSSENKDIAHAIASCAKKFIIG